MEKAGKRKAPVIALLILAVSAAATFLFVLRLLSPAQAGRTLSKGDIVQLGRFEQDNDPENGPEPVEWIVLDRIEDAVLLISARCLDARPYHDAAFRPVTWEKCALRKWLNETFFAETFSREEQLRIVPADNLNPDQSALGTEGGADTRDYVFLLGEKEAGIYMGDEISREYVGRAAATEYASRRGAWTDEEGYAVWWLRSPGAYTYSAQFVEASGEVYRSGAYVDVAYGLRPAVWMRAEEDGEQDEA